MTQPETVAIHAGQTIDPTTHALAVPIYQTVAYGFDDAEHAADLFALRRPGNIYTRLMNPTTSVLEERVAALEGGVGALATSSGAAAITYAVLNLARAGDNIVSVTTLYGGTYALFANTLAQFGIEARFVSPDDAAVLDGVVDEGTRLVFCESIGNPALNIIDLDAWSAKAHERGRPLIVDNTLRTPILCLPFEHGADIVVHSTTKYMGGHGTALGGVIVDSGTFDWAAHADRFPVTTAPAPAYHGVVWTEAAGAAAYIIRARTVLLRNTGATPAPMNSFLTLQGIETLALRMERHSTNAMTIATYLEAHDAVDWVNYPGLESSPAKAIGDRVLTGKGYAGLVSFGLKAGRAAGEQFIGALELFSHVANIGDVRSLAIHNASTTHSQLNSDELRAAGVPPEMVRLSVGIEHVDELIADLEQALTKAGA